MSINPTLLHLVYFALLNTSIILAGYVLAKKRMVLLSWLMLLITVPFIYLVFLHNSPVLIMFAVIATTFTGMKIIVTAESYKYSKSHLNFTQWLAFNLSWAGMRWQPFETLGARALPAAGKMIRFGLSRIIAGLTIIALARLISTISVNAKLNHAIISVMLLAGFSFILHFGLLNISAGLLKLQGVNSYFLFREPAKAISLSEFWGKRWNLAFSEMTSIAIYRPVKSKFGSGVALLLSFGFSGLLHELALSLPVNSGYGLPTLYFMIQGLAVYIEKILIKHSPEFLNNRLATKLWLCCWIVLPSPLLFHPQFISKIVWPMAGLHY